MNEALKPILKIHGIRGAALLTADGVLMASEFREVDGEALAALASQLACQAEAEAARTGLEGFRRLTLRGIYGTLYLARWEELILVVAAGPQGGFEGIWPRIEEAAASLPQFRGN